MSITVELPCGIPDGQGGVLKSAVIKKMTGRTRQLIGDVKVQRSTEKFVTTILTSCVENVGGSPMTDDLAGKMVQADRNFLLLEIRKATNGAVVESRGACQACGELMDMKFDIEGMLEDIAPADDMHVEGDNFYTVISIPEYDLEAKVRIPNAKNSGDLEKIISENPIEGMYRMFTKCCTSYKSKSYPEPKRLSYDQFLDLDLNEFDALAVEFQKHMPKTGDMFLADCPSCEAENTITINPADFFFPGLRQMG